MMTTHVAPRSRRPGRLLLAAAGAAALLAAGHVTASAQAPTAPSLDYAQWAIGVAPDASTVGDCRVSYGPVRDSVAYPNYRKIAGVQVNCSTRKNVIEAYVALQKWEGGRWVQKGTRGYGILFNSLGSGGLKKGSQPVCGGRNSYWRTVTTFRIGSNGGWWTAAGRAVHDPSGC